MKVVPPGGTEQSVDVTSPKPDDVRFELVVSAWEGNPAHCIYLNDHRIAGGKPWGGGTTTAKWSVSLADLRRALPGLDINLKDPTHD